MIFTRYTLSKKPNAIGRERSNISADDAHDIRMLYKINGERMTDLAERYGVCVSTISGIIHYRTWREA